MTVLTPNGSVVTDREGNTVVMAGNTSTWADLASWDTWNAWIAEPETELRWLTDPIDLGRTEYFNVGITADIVGLVEYRIYTSLTGAFAGEETETVIAEGAEDVEGFYGRYAMIGIVVTYDSAEGTPQIRSFNWRVNGETLTFRLNDINSSTLGGSISGRILELPQTVSKIVNIQITPFFGGDYVESDYWAADYVEDGYIPTAGIRDKLRSAPKIVFKYGTTYVESQFDCAVTALPQQYRNGKNLEFR